MADRPRKLIPLALAVVICAAAADRENVGTAVVLRKSPSELPSITPHWRNGLSCGVTSCYILLKLIQSQGGDPDIQYSSVEAAIPISAEGTSLLEMKDGLRELNLDAEVIRVAPSDFDAIRWPAIAHVPPVDRSQGSVGHYLVVLATGDHYVRVIDPRSAAVISVPSETFFRRCSGYLLIPGDAAYATISPYLVLVGEALCIMLLFAGVWLLRTVTLSWRQRDSSHHHAVSRVAVFLALCHLIVGCSKPSQSVDVNDSDFSSKRNAIGGRDRSQGFGLTVWKQRCNVGGLFDGEHAVGTFIIENTGTIPTEITAGMPSCSCSSLEIAQSHLLPGAQTEVRMSVKNQSKAGPFVTYVNVGAKGRDWLQRLEVHAFGFGLSTPGYTLYWTPSNMRPRTVTATLFTPDADTSVDLHAVIKGTPELRQILHIDPIEISSSEYSEGYFMKTARITIHVKREAAISPGTTLAGLLKVKSSFPSGRKQFRTLELRIVGPESPSMAATH